MQLHTNKDKYTQAVGHTIANQLNNKQIQLPAKLLEYFLRSNKSNMKKSQHMNQKVSAQVLLARMARVVSTYHSRAYHA